MKSILVIGLNNFGKLVAKQFHQLGHDVMAIDQDENRVNEILPYVTDAQIGDSTNENFLKSLGINNFDVCIVALAEDFQVSLETTALLKELGSKLVVARADRDVQAKFLLRNGADEVINPEKQFSEWVAIRYSANHILDYIKLDDQHAIYEIPVPKDWIGKTVGQLDVRKKFGIYILGLKEDGKTILPIAPEMVLNKKKTMLVLGENKSVQKFFRI